MNWELFYLVCFLLGLGLSAISLLGGMGHFGGHMHVPHAHLPHPAHLPAHGGAAHLPSDAGSSGTATVPWWNFFSLTVFLCWFGASGYLLTRYGGFVAGLVLVLAALCGVAGGAIVFFFLVKVLLPHDRELTAGETEVVGVVGRISAAIRPGGIGEIVYEQLGSRCAVPARSEDGLAIAHGEEAFVLRYENGVAWVRRWDELEPLDRSMD